MNEIICTKCNLAKPISEFRKRKERPVKGVNSWCADCRNKSARKWRKRKKEENLQSYRRMQWNQNLKKSYGISADDYDKILEKQNYKCALCSSSDPRGKGKFHVDHNHSTGKVRGLLCHNCNTGIGSLYDDINLLEKAKFYLTKYEKYNYFEGGDGI